MIRALIIITVASFVLALGCFAGVAAFAGRELAANGWVWPAWENYGVHISDASDGARTPDEVRKLDWTGGDTLRIDLPADVKFGQSERPEVVIEGPADLLPFVALKDGRLYLTDESAGVSLGRLDELEISIFAPGVRRFVVNGSPRLAVSNYDQENLTVEINGSGSATVEGRTDRLAATISGSGEADLENLTVTDANLKVVGSGDVKTGPTGAVQVAIAGSGDVHLLRKPASLTSQVDGSGDVHEAN